VQELLDRQAGPEVLAQIRAEALSVPGVRGVEKLLVRKAGLEYLVDIHVEVDPEVSVREGHAIGHAVKDALVGKFVAVKDVLVHIEPAPGQEASRGS
jgi:divalent metal cation (Fe/Co/Zn/Cd) transporter